MNEPNLNPLNSEQEIEEINKNIETLNKEVICQSCAIELNEHNLGTNADESPSPYYCINCFENGNFTETLIFEEVLEEIASVAEEVGYSKEEAIEYARNKLSSLKRWQ